MRLNSLVSLSDSWPQNALSISSLWALTPSPSSGVVSAAAVAAGSDPLSFSAVSLITLEAVLEVVIICVAGYVAARTNLLLPSAQTAISRLNVDLFTPCLVFIKLAPALSLKKMAELGVIPIFFVLTTGISYAALRVTATLLNLNDPESDFVTAMAVFGNSNSLPVSLTLTLAYTLPGLLWDELDGDSSDKVASRGMLYLLIFQQLGQVLRWTWGFNTLLKKRSWQELNTYNGELLLEEEAEPLVHDEINELPPYLSTTDLSGDVGQPDIHAKIAAPSSPTVSNQVMEITRPTTAPHPVIARLSNAALSLIQSKPVVKVLEFMNPPLYAMLLLVVVASIPALRDLFFASLASTGPNGHNNSFVANTLTRSITQLGQVLIPLILIVLGSNLAPSKEIAANLRHHSRVVFAALVSRMILPALVLLPLIAFAVKVINVSILDDPIFLIVAFILTTSPPAIQLSQITQINGVFQAEMASVLFWGYVVLTLPSTIIIVVTSLEVLEWAT